MSQADAAPITGDTIVTGGKSALPTVKSNGLAVMSRRGALGALALVAAPVAAVPLATASDNASTWNEALHAWRKADAAYDAFFDKIWNPVQVELERRTPEPARSFSITTASGKTVTYDFVSSDPDCYARNPIPAISNPGRRMAEEWREWHIQYKAVAAELNVDALYDEDNRLYELRLEARDRLMNTPAPHVAAVLAKLEIMWEDRHKEREEENELIVMGDLRRLAA
ncbi:hypothetical protein [Sphingobium yanoikuyae]|uniref:hypothetical protein n=1 Tax=Sphingobium yanoikuyae TaxID=13690 RepID=UPI00243272D4|nr:hypothetical protein [Sphingobium yanoikuyae]